jgi:ATP-dependent helicase YprA (DUF1998 family)
LYIHQPQAIEAALCGEHVVVVTAPASGKTLCYNLPVLNELLANPRATALYLFPTKMTLVDADGTPRGAKHFLIVNPPLVDLNLGQRRSAMLETRDIAARFITAGMQTIAFARSRLTTEVLLTYIREAAASQGVDPQMIRGYRGGYLADERRAKEACAMAACAA